MLDFLLLILPILFALTVHEYAHGWVAYRLGDPTAYHAGRLTFNPIKHLDPIGTILLFIARIGWAKPVPVNPAYFKDPSRDMAIVALAGPASNFLSAIVFGKLLSLVPFTNVYLYQTLFYFVYINLILAFFNLIPIAPLDGWRILSYFLPDTPTKLTIERAGPVLLLIIIAMPMFLGIPVFSMFLNPLMKIGLKIAIGGTF